MKEKVTYKDGTRESVKFLKGERGNSDRFNTERLILF